MLREKAYRERAKLQTELESVRNEEEKEASCIETLDEQYDLSRSLKTTFNINQRR